MRLSQAVRKLSQCTFYGFDHVNSVWVLLPYKALYPTDGRFIGRSVSFYDRRVLITPEEIDPQYAVVRIGTPDIDAEELMIYAAQKNINRDEPYLYSHTGFNIQGYANIRRMTKTTAASGLSKALAPVITGTYPVALEKGFSAPASNVADGLYTSRMACYIPRYADVQLADMLEFGPDTYTVDEILPELRLTFMQLTKK